MISSRNRPRGTGARKGASGFASPHLVLTQTERAALRWPMRPTLHRRSAGTRMPPRRTGTSARSRSSNIDRSPSGALGRRSEEVSGYWPVPQALAFPPGTRTHLRGSVPRCRGAPCRGGSPEEDVPRRWPSLQEVRCMDGADGRSATANIAHLHPGVSHAENGAAEGQHGREVQDAAVEEDADDGRVAWRCGPHHSG